MRLDPQALEPVLALADLCLYNGKQAMAVELLQGTLAHSNRDVVHTKLAEVYTAMRQYTQALAHYHTALSLSPHSVQAARGLDRLEKTMRGVDGIEAEHYGAACTEWGERLSAVW